MDGTIHSDYHTMSKQECESIPGVDARPNAGEKGRPATKTSHSQVEQRRRELVALLEQQLSIAEIATRTGYSTRWVREIALRYHLLGTDALRDQREHCGAAPLLSEEMQGALRLALQSAPAEGGCWTGPKVARWIEVQTGRPVHRQRGWEYLCRLGQSATTD
jgi:transposase